MKIICPISNPDEVKPLIEAGADELYCGLSAGGNKTRCLNRFPTPGANLINFRQLEEAVKTAHSHGVPVNFTLNCFYNEQNSRLAERAVRDAMNAGVDSLIVQDIGILKLLKTIKNCPDIHIGTLGTSLNAETINFYKEMGGSRVVLERHMTLEEIKTLSKETDVELEVFILNRRALFIDGLCTFCDVKPASGAFCLDGIARIFKIKAARVLAYSLPYSLINFAYKRVPVSYGCCLPYRLDYPDEPGNIKTGLGKNMRKFNIDTYLNACGCCALRDLYKAAVRYVKIVGRLHAAQKKIKDVAFVRAARDLARTEISAGEFRMKVKELYKNTYSAECRPNYCYYPME